MHAMSTRKGLFTIKLFLGNEGHKNISLARCKNIYASTTYYRSNSIYTIYAPIIYQHLPTNKICTTFDSNNIIKMFQ